jgi:hypothetical protein
MYQYIFGAKVGAGMVPEGDSPNFLFPPTPLETTKG